MEPRFTLLTLGVADLEKSFRFYHHGLGWPSAGIVGREFEHGAAAFFDLPHGMKLSLYGQKDLAWDAGVAAGLPAPPVFSIGYIVRDQAEVDAVMALAQRAGATISQPARPTFWGGYAGYFQDPDGHLWEIAWNPQLLPDTP